jgi:predicted dehydrogenase
MQAGKDVYVEKPVSHNVQEGRRMVEAARRYQRICQAGLQARSDPGTRKAIAFVQSGAIGSVRLARGLSYRRRTPPDPAGPSNVPEHVDYSLWLGPAPAAPPMRPRFHHDWHWQWSYGNGDAGDQGVHQMDLCRWGLQCPTISHRVFSCGRSFSSLHAAETADTQLMIHQYPNATIVWESCGAPEPARRPVPSGVIFEGSEGYLVMTGYRGGTAFDRLGREIARFRGGGGPSHFSNFLQAVRRGRCQLLNADIEEGHLSGSLCHTGNISYRLGRTVCQMEALGEFPDVEAVAPSDGVRERLEIHLRGDGSADDRALRRLGVVLACDPASETFRDHPAANSLLTRLYRRPFVVPAAGSV